VRRAPAHHHAQGDHRIVVAGARHAAAGERDLPGAGHPGDVDVVVGHAVTPQTVETTVEQLLTEQRVEPAHHHAEALALAVVLPFQNPRHHCSS